MRPGLYEARSLINGKVGYVLVEDVQALRLALVEALDEVRRLRRAAMGKEAV